ncbi:hypothetical protein [Stutzerimonas nitrititolerans]|uniref:hypothetical protein n=1 Tax=Stutzerimonas nitrititolerans TaxID=2482751 RepID=UPI00289D736A|nr:hypothetical protein [Stutzerimonas nitrititolerans]
MSTLPQLVYLAFGPEIYQKEAFFSISSAICMQNRFTPDFRFGIQVFTDTPEFYDPLPVTALPLNRGWYGPADYRFRAKHAIVREVLDHHERVVLIDSDTFFKRSPAELFARIKPGQVLCNFFGAPLKNLPSQEILQAAELQVSINKENKQTNSGVIGLVREDRGVVEQSIALMDHLHPRFPDYYTLEELCLAIAASHSNLTECKDVIHHYWSRKGIFRAKVEAWFRRHGSTPLSQPALEDIGHIDEHLPKPEHPLRAVQKLTTMAFPRAHRQFCRELLYGCHPYKNEYDRACAEAWYAKAEENLMDIGAIASHDIREIIKHPLFALLAGRGHKEIINFFERSRQARQEASN